jgi:hypothetical protein
MVIAAIYECYLGKTEERILNLKSPSLDVTKNKVSCPKIKVWIDPQHFMNIKTTFLRQKNLNEFCTVVFSCYAFGNERLSLMGTLAKDECLVESRNFDLGKSYISPACIDVNEEEEELQAIYGSCMINSGVNFEFYHDLISQCSDFIIETEDLIKTQK